MSEIGAEPITQDANPYRTIKLRHPILEASFISGFGIENHRREWNLITEKIRRAVVESSSMRTQLIPLVSRPLSQSYAAESIDSAGKVDPELRKLNNRYKDQIGGYLRLPSVPDEMIIPDVANAPYHHIPQEDVDDIVWELLNTYGLQEGTAEFYREKNRKLLEISDKGRYSQGLTREEKELIFSRYEYGRDMKLLAFAADLHEQRQSKQLQPDSKGKIILEPSGTVIGIDRGTINADSDLLDPARWEKREQIGDRVYQIIVSGKKYIMKERKTKFHRQVLLSGHRNGRTSEGEFFLGNLLQEYAETKGDILVSFEKPLGYVQFPDGYQFALFRYEEDLISARIVSSKLEEAILSDIANHRAEFLEISSRLIKYLSDRRVLKFTKSQGDVLSFESFAKVKTAYLIDETSKLLYESEKRAGYWQADSKDQRVFRIHKNGHVGLEIIGIDYEYYEKLHTGTKAENIQTAELRQEEGIGYHSWEIGHPVTQIEQAAFLALKENRSKTQES